MVDIDRLASIKNFISEIVSKSFSDELETTKKEEIEVEIDGEVLGEVYESIEDYTQKTGKRFRMTKDQKDRDLTRDQAFEEFIQENKDV